MPVRKPRRAGLLLKTGQTTQYDSELDDGYYQKGLAKRYEVLDSGQHAGACVFVLNGKTETQSHNCVRDLVTGLMWARYTSAKSASVGPDSNGRLPWTGADDDIFAYCAAANAAELGGYSDWRVANLFELLSLASYEATTAVPDTTAFPDWPVSWFWSSTTRPDDTTRAEYVSSKEGGVYGGSKTLRYYVVLVRGGV